MEKDADGFYTAPASGALLTSITPCLLDLVLVGATNSDTAKTDTAKTSDATIGTFSSYLRLVGRQSTNFIFQQQPLRRRLRISSNLPLTSMWVSPAGLPTVGYKLPSRLH
jgi:hypothetical protein